MRFSKPKTRVKGWWRWSVAQPLWARCAVCRAPSPRVWSGFDDGRWECLEHTHPEMRDVMLAREEPRRVLNPPARLLRRIF